jgi:hypothetical protein
VGQHGLEDASVAEVEVPVVRARDGELRGHGGRPQARAVGRAEADAERLGRPEEGDRVVLRMRVRGGGDGDLHWLSLSLYSIRLSPPVATTAAWGGSPDWHAAGSEVGFGLFGLSWIRVEHWASFAGLFGLLELLRASFSRSRFPRKQVRRVIVCLFFLRKHRVSF